MISKSSQDSANTDTYEFDEYIFDIRNKVLFRGTEMLTLAPKACELLAVLIENRGKVVSRDDLLGRVWSDSFVEEANLTHHISSLRKALGEDKNGRKFIETIPRKGYRFVAAIDRRGDGQSEITITEKTVLRIDEEQNLETSPVDDDAGNSARAEKPSNARAGKLFVGAAIFGLLTLGAAFFAFRYFSAPPNHAAPELKVKRLTPDSNALAPAVSPDGGSVVFIGLENGRETLWRKQIQTGELTQLLPAASTDDRRILYTRYSPDGRWIYFSQMEGRVYKQNVFRVSVNGGTPRQILADVETDFSVSPDGKSIAFTYDFRQLVVADAETGARRVVIERDGVNETIKSLNENSVAWSPDGARLVCAGSVFRDNRNVQQLLEVDVRTGALNLIPIADDVAVFQIEWQGDEDNLYVTRQKAAGFPSELWRIAYPGGAATRLSNDADDFEVIRLSADGKTLVAEQKLGGFNIWTAPADNPAAKKQITVGAAARQGYLGLSFAPDWKIIYTSLESGVFDLWATGGDGGERKQLTVNVGKMNAGPSATADGRYIVFRSNRGGTTQIWRTDADGRNPVQLSVGIETFDFSLAPDDTVYYHTFLPDAQKYQVYRVPVAGGTPVKFEDGVFYYQYVPFFSPDGKWTLAYGSQTQNEPPQVCLLERATGKVVRRFPKISRHVHWSPDSKAIYYASGGNQQLWRQPIEEGEPVQLTDYYPLLIFAFDVSPDGKRMAFSLGNTTSEIVQIQNFNGAEQAR